MVSGAADHSFLRRHLPRSFSGSAFTAGFGETLLFFFTIWQPQTRLRYDKIWASPLSPIQLGVAAAARSCKRSVSWYFAAAFAALPGWHARLLLRRRTAFRAFRDVEQPP